MIREIKKDINCQLPIVRSQVSVASFVTSCMAVSGPGMHHLPWPGLVASPLAASLGPQAHLRNPFENHSKSTGPGIPKGGPTSSKNGAKSIKKCATSVTQNAPSTSDPKNLSFYIPGSLKTALPPGQESYFHNLQGCQKTSRMKPKMTLKFN